MISDLREAVRVELQADVGIEFAAGAPPDEGPVARRDRGYVWVEGFARDPTLAIWEEIDVRARLYLQYVEPRSDEEPVPPGPLENAAESLRDALQNKRSLLDLAGGRWLLAFVGVELDYASQSAEASVTAGRENPYET